jgi:putative addiction module component (TIGR02574 family)
MKQFSVADIPALRMQERIRLIDLIWDSIAAVPKAVEVTSKTTAEREERLKEFEANPEAGYS